MKRKELRQIAEKIAKAEKIIQTSDNEKLVKQAEQDIVNLTSSVHDFEDIIAIDELVQDLLSK